MLDTSCKRNKGLDNKVKNKNYSRNHTFLDFSLLCFLLVEASIETMLQWTFILHLNERYNVCRRKGIKQPLSLRVICHLLSLFPFITTLMKLFTFFSLSGDKVGLKVVSSVSLCRETWLWMFSSVTYYHHRHPPPRHLHPSLHRRLPRLPRYCYCCYRRSRSRLPSPAFLGRW